MSDQSWLSSPMTIYDEMFSEDGICASGKFQSLITEHVDRSPEMVPVVNTVSLDAIPDGHMVCVEGMVQDMFNVELYMDEFFLEDKSTRCSFRYRDYGSQEADSIKDPQVVKFSERQSFYIIPVPGESSWVKTIYDELKDALKINELVQIYGILEHTRLGSVLEPDDFESGSKGMEPIPRVHALVVRRQRHNNPLLQTVPNPLSDGQQTTTCQLTGPIIPATRAVLISTLLECLQGDMLSAEYTLLHLVASRLPVDSPYPITLPALNIVGPTVETESQTTSDTNVTASSTAMLLERLSLLFPCLTTQFARLELTIDSLNKGPNLIPVRDATKGALDTGRLQLPSGTQILADETRMTSGQLQPRGVLNLRALTLLATKQCVPYDFQFYTQDWESDCRMLIISTGPSLIKPVQSIWWAPQADFTPVDCSYDQADPKWMSMRKLITQVASYNGLYSMDDALQERVNEDFVKWRREKETFIEADDLAVMLCLLRLYCLTYGETHATLDQWEKVCGLEKQRRSRFKSKKTVNAS